MNKSRRDGSKLFASLLILLGVSSLLANLLAFAMSLHDIGIVDAVVGAVSGIAATTTGVWLWENKESTQLAYLTWCFTLGMYWLTIPELFVLQAIPAFAVAIIMLAWGFRFVRKLTRRTA